MIIAANRPAPRFAYLIPGFVATAQANGMRNIWAALPAGHQLVKTNRVGQIRKVKGELASCFDELGNRTILTVDGFVKQL